MYSKSKRFIASFLAVLMAVCMLPVDMFGAVGVVHAADIAGEITVTLKQDSYVYTGSPIVPELQEVTAVLVADTTAVDVTESSSVTATNNTNVTTDSSKAIATVTVNHTDSGETYTGSKDVEFTITALPLVSKDDSGNTTVSATGVAGLEPTVTVTVDGAIGTLSKGTDYDVDCYTATDSENALTSFDGVEENDVITVKVTGKGNFSGTVTTSYTAGAGTSDKVDISDATKATVTLSTTTPPVGTVPTVSVVILGEDGAEGDALEAGTDYTVKYTCEGTDYTDADDTALKALGAGKEVTVTVTGTGNYTGTKTLQYTVANASNKTNLSDATVTLKVGEDAFTGPVTYSGAEVAPTPTVTLNSVTLDITTGFEVVYEKKGTDNQYTELTGNNKPTDAGTYKVTVKASTDNDDYTGKVSSADFTIDPLALTDTEGAGKAAITVNKTAAGAAPGFTVTVKLTADAATEETLTADDYEEPVYKKDGTVVAASAIVKDDDITIEITGKGNYSGTVTQTYTATEAVVGPAAPTLDASVPSTKIITSDLDGAVKTVKLNSAPGTKIYYVTNISENYRSFTKPEDFLAENAIVPLYVVKSASNEAEIVIAENQTKIKAIAVVEGDTPQPSDMETFEFTFKTNDAANTHTLDMRNFVRYQTGTTQAVVQPSAKYDNGYFFIDERAETETVDSSKRKFDANKTAMPEGNIMGYTAKNPNNADNDEREDFRTYSPGRGMDYSNDDKSNGMIKFKTDKKVEVTVGTKASGRGADYNYIYLGILKKPADGTDEPKSLDESSEDVYKVPYDSANSTGNYAAAGEHTFTVEPDKDANGDYVLTEFGIASSDTTKNKTPFIFYVKVKELDSGTPGPGPNPGPEDPDDDPEDPEVIEANGLWIGGIKAEGYDYANGAKITPAVRVYHGSKRLTEKVDYTVSYKNNVNVAAADAADNKKPTIVVKGKGNYAGTATKTFVINPATISEDNCDSEMAVVAKKNDKGQKPLPTVSVLVNGKVKKLKNKTDYDVKYYAATVVGEPAETDLKDEVTAAGAYKVRVTGKKNYTGTADIPLTVIATDSTMVLASKLKVTVAKVTYDKATATAVGFDGFEPEVTVKAGKDTLTKDTDYTLSWSNNEVPGTASVTVTAKPAADASVKFVGTKTVNFKIAGATIKSCKVDVSAADLTFTGDEEAFCTEIGDKLVVKKGSTTLDKTGATGVTNPEYDYDVKIDESNKTKVIVTVKGKLGYEGTVVKTFKVKPLAIDDTKVSITVNYPDAQSATPAVPFMKGGAKPTVTAVVTYGEGADDKYTFTEGVDYTLSYAKNKAVGDGTIKVKGKGVLKGTKPVTFTIGAKALNGNVSLVANNVALNNGGKYDCKPVVLDADGVKLANKKDYTLRYFYKAPAAANDPEQVDESGATSDVPTGYTEISDTINKYKEGVAGGKIIVRATAKDGGAYTGYIEKEYEIRTNNFAKAKIKISAQNYDGTAVVFTPDNGKIAAIEVKVGDVTLDPQSSADSTTDGYYIASYDKNDKKGTAKITLVGTGSYAGSKTASFKIGAKTMAWWTKPSGSASEALEYLKDAVTGLFN